MVYRNFSTKNAGYVLQLGNHLIPNGHSITPLEDCDVVVLEKGRIKIPKDFDYYFRNSQMGIVAQMAKNMKKPIYICDIDTTNVGLLRDIISVTSAMSIPSLALPCYLSGTLPFLLFGPSLLLKEWNKGLFCNTNTFLHYLLQAPTTEARNAINARNLEEFVAPHISEKIGRKPKIGLVYGAGHSGLEFDLKHPRFRDMTIWNYRNLNFGKYAGLKKEEINQVTEVNFVDKKPEFTFHDTNLFQ